MANVRRRGTKPVAKRIPRAQGMRLAATEVVGGSRFQTSKEQRKPQDAKPRRPKITVREDDGKAIITTRRTQKPRAKQSFPFLEATAPLKKRWKPQMRNITRIRIVKPSSKPEQEPVTVAMVTVPPQLDALRMKVRELVLKRPPISRVGRPQEG